MSDNKEPELTPDEEKLVASFSEMLNNDDGGHAMLFKSAGKLMISYHAPNSKTERPVIYPVRERQGRLRILQ